MKAVAGRLRLDYAQYLEMKMFSRFGGFGDSATAARLVRGERIAALLAQSRFQPLPRVAQVALLAALDAGLLDNESADRIATLKQALPDAVSADPKLDALRADPATLTDEMRAACTEAVHAALAAL